MVRKGDGAKDQTGLEDGGDAQSLGEFFSILSIFVRSSASGLLSI